MSDFKTPGWTSTVAGPQAETLVHYPHELRSGWLPRSRAALQKFHQMIHAAEPSAHAPSIARLDAFI